MMMTLMLTYVSNDEHPDSKEKLCELRYVQILCSSGVIVKMFTDARSDVRAHRDLARCAPTQKQSVQ